ncbi:MAG: hypothetical protein KKC84_02955 [Candidatus Omnitrophica bacterium]|nr:hypothetical protein [Candidatus Omnitrophota bacterium]
MNIFHIAEIVDLGIEKEKKRRDFYALAAQRFQDNTQLKELFVRLTDWEDQHIKKFTEIRQSLNETEAAESYPGELSGYMQLLVDEQLYQEVSSEKFSANIKTVQDAIDYGIRFEKEAILFFIEVLSYAQEKEKETIKKLIAEEKEHIVYLALLRQKIVQEGKR